MPVLMAATQVTAKCVVRLCVSGQCLSNIARGYLICITAPRTSALQHVDTAVMPASYYTVVGSTRNAPPRLCRGVTYCCYSGTSRVENDIGVRKHISPTDARSVHALCRGHKQSWIQALGHLNICCCIRSASNLFVEGPRAPITDATWWRKLGKRFSRCRAVPCWTYQCPSYTISTKPRATPG
eukprot:COSAG01_NODE_777_length_13689_cov_18.035467_14_plen_183_part_00